MVLDKFVKVSAAVYSGYKKVKKFANDEDVKKARESVERAADTYEYSQQTQNYADSNDNTQRLIDDKQDTLENFKKERASLQGSVSTTERISGKNYLDLDATFRRIKDPVISQQNERIKALNHEINALESEIARLKNQLM